MLVLTRKLDEKIIIGNEIEVQILGIDQNRVKLGISAPSEIRIYREEVYSEIRRENLEASGIDVQLWEELLPREEKEE